MASKSNLLAALQHAMGIVKSTPDEQMQDVEPVYSIVDGNTDDTNVPSAAEILTMGPSIAARGADAEVQVKRNSDLQPQTDVTAAYMEINGRMTDLMKGYNSLATAFNSLTSALTKAATVKKADDEEKGEDDDAKGASEKAHRKARIEVRKAESADEDEADMVMDSAEKAIKAFADAISKAEDDADSDEKEKASEKARTALKTLRTSLKSIREGFAAAKAAKTLVVAVKSEDDEANKKEKDEDGHMKAITEFAALKGITVKEMLAQLTTPQITPAPVFSKSLTKAPEDVMTSMDVALSAGRISDGEFQSGMGLLQKRDAAKAGLISESQFHTLFSSSSPAIQDIFTAAA
jgi:hypothetical protein